MSRQRVIYREKDDLVKSTLNEIILFLLFFFLILLGENQEVLIGAQKEVENCKAKKEACESNLGGASQRHDILSQRYDFCKGSLKNCERAKDNLLFGAQKEVENCKAKKEACESNLGGASQRHDILSQRYDFCKGSLKNCERAKDNLPSTIVLSEAAGNTFKQGEFSLNETFKENITEKIIPAIEIHITQKDYVVERILIIGHADETAKRGKSTLDDKLVDFLHEDAEASSLRVADNAGLGLVRAASVRQYLLKNSTIFEKENIPVLILSAGQVIEFGKISDRIPDDEDREEQRRRIEIYLVTYPVLDG